MKRGQILFLTIFMVFCGCQNSNKIVFPEGLATYSVTDSLPFNSEWFHAEKKLVIFSEGLYIFSIPFMDVVEEESGDLPVIIYISVEDKDLIVETLKKYNFGYPFIHDPEKRFLLKNNLRKRLGLSDRSTLFPIFMEGDEIYEPAEIGMREILRDQLSRFMGE